ncbi:MAG: hypothetical protein AB1331_02405 [Bacillota bacterium]
MDELNSLLYPFRRVRHGYDPEQVETELKRLTEYCSAQEREVASLSKALEKAQQRESLAREAVRALENALKQVENQAGQRREKARGEADQLREEGQRELTETRRLAARIAETIVQRAEQQAREREEQARHRIFCYERELRLTLDSFYTLARRHLRALESDLIDQLRGAVARLDADDAPAIPCGGMVQVPGESTSGRWGQAEHSLLCGRTLARDVVDSEGRMVVPRYSVVTPEMVEDLIERGLYGELIEALMTGDGEGNGD